MSLMHLMKVLVERVAAAINGVCLPRGGTCGGGTFLGGVPISDRSDESDTVEHPLSEKGPRRGPICRSPHSRAKPDEWG